MSSATRLGSPTEEKRTIVLPTRCVSTGNSSTSTSKASLNCLTNDATTAAGRLVVEMTTPVSELPMDAAGPTTAAPGGTTVWSTPGFSWNGLYGGSASSPAWG